MIKKITFEIETITPMFLSGANQSKPELRAASIKGLLRFWWRAIRAENNTKKLLDEESSIFGAPDEKIGGSKFFIRVTHPDKEPLPRFNSQGRQDPVGYMFYSTFMQQGRERQYFPEGSKFKITLTSRDENILKIASASLWALIYLGGLGTRTRRGAGNIVVTNVKNTNEILSDNRLDFIPKGNNSEDIAKWLIDNLKSVKQQIIDKTDFASEYSNLSFSRFIISNNHFSTWRDALGSTGFKTFRDSNKAKIFETASFGFPIIHRTNRTTVTGRAGNDPFARRSSPLIFKVIKADNSFYWIVIRLAGEFLPEGGVIKAGTNTQKPDYGIIDEFWIELKNKGKEHILSMPDTLGHIKNEIVKQTDPQKIILFGSKARGDFHRRSDTDIAIQTEKQLDKLSSISGAIDIVDLKRADERLKAKIQKEGVVIYERKS